jgi:hypothetical protein
MKWYDHTHHSPHAIVVEYGIKDGEIGQLRITETTRVTACDSNAIHGTHTEGRNEEQGNINFCSVRGPGRGGGKGAGEGGWTYLTLISGLNDPA